MTRTDQSGSAPSRRFEGKVAVVTGAAQGIGQATALRLAAEGAAVVAVDVQDRDETTVAIAEAGGRGTRVVADVTSAAQWDTVVRQAHETFGGLDILTNIAGIVNRQGPDTVEELTEDIWQHMIDTNLKSVWLGMRAVIPSMRQRGGGRIVNVSSSAGMRPVPNVASYAASKGGVAALTRQAAVQYADEGILVNCVAPGTTDTPILDGVSEERRQAFAAAHVIHRLGRPEEVASMVAYLCADEAAFLTGLTFPVDGGWTINGGTSFHPAQTQ